MSDREPTQQRPGGRSGMSISGTLSIIVAAVAVILGFLILRDINDSGDASSGGGGGGQTTEPTSPGGPNNTGDTPGTSSTTAAPQPKEYTVIVANAAKVDGAAGQLTTALQGAGVNTATATDSSLTTAESTTTIFFLPEYENEAKALAEIMGVTSAPQAMPDPPPLKSGVTLGPAQVLVQLGTDKAGQPLPIASTPSSSPATGDAATPST